MKILSQSRLQNLRLTASLFTCFPLLRIAVTEVMYTPKNSAVKLNRALTKLLRNKRVVAYVHDATTSGFERARRQSRYVGETNQRLRNS